MAVCTDNQCSYVESHNHFKTLMVTVPILLVSISGIPGSTSSNFMTVKVFLILVFWS